MQFYKYWTTAKGTAVDNQGNTIERRALGYSNESVADAKRVALERAERLASNRANPATAHDYSLYPGSDAIREETVEEFRDGAETIAVISRNSYGCLVLNTTDVFFADVDRPSATVGGWISGLFGKKPDFEQQLIEKIETLVANRRGMGLRVYRTAAGYRIVMLNETLPAEQAQSAELLSTLGADRLYVSLCRTQDCYRARLSPKPWRCNFHRPPNRFPFLNEGDEKQFRNWQVRYDAVATEFATCVVLGNFGSETLHPRVDHVLKLHDHFVLNENKTLA